MPKGVCDEQRGYKKGILRRIFCNARGVRYDRRGVTCHFKFLI